MKLAARGVQERREKIAGWLSAIVLAA